MQRFIVANMLRHWEQTCDIIQKEPHGRFTGEHSSSHPYISIVKRICGQLHISDETFSSWVKDVKQGFLLNNSYSMSQTVLEEAGITKHNIDGRAFNEKMDWIITQ